MNDLYTKLLIVLAAVAIIAALAFGVLWQNNRTITEAADRSMELAAEQFGKQRLEDQAAYDARVRELEERVDARYSEARQRVAELDQRQRRDTAALIRRIDQIPDSEVGEPVALVLEQSRERWPE
jgi:DnaJ-domain-containing protein 1